MRLSIVDLLGDPAASALRDEIRSFVEEHGPTPDVRRGVRAPDAADVPAIRRWMALLYEAGYLGGDWPLEHGGSAAAHPLTGPILTEELIRQGVAVPLGAHDLASGALIGFGSADQKAYYLPRIRRTDDLWCQLFSEPGAGSDLAGLQTTAVLQGDELVVNGQKVWTTNGHVADLGFLLARTDRTVEKHAGISALIVDMRAPGVDIRPLRELTGTYDFNEVFFTDVRIPRDRLIGGLNDGWRVATETLARERQGNAGLATVLQILFEETLEFARQKADGEITDPPLRQSLAELYSRVVVASLVNVGVVLRGIEGSSRTSDAPMNKIMSAELDGALTTFAMTLVGARGLLDSDEPESLGRGHWQDDFLHARQYSIAGGTDQVLRNLIGERALGLPREPKPQPGGSDGR